MLRTLPRRGYRFTSDVVAVPSVAASSFRNGTGTQGSSGFPPSVMASHRERDENVAEENAAPSQLPSTSLRHPAAVDPDENRLEALPAERRQLTIMACDVAGLTVLTARLDLENLPGDDDCLSPAPDKEIIERYHGHVANYSADGVLAYFGYPQADEHDAERAILAGLALVEAVPNITPAAGFQTLNASVGIATGIVVAGVQGGSSAAQTVTAVGGALNLAARLRGLASADQIVIAASTRRLLGNAFELTDLGEHLDLKGIAEPVHVWRVERALVTESRFDANRCGSALTPLVGREEELDLLLRRWSQARDGEGQVVLLSGEPGIGKSRILSTLRERLEAQGVQALRFQCSPYYVNSAFWPIIDNFERTLKFARDETTDAKLDKLEALIVTHYGRPLADVRFVASILSIPCEQRYGACL